MQALRVLRICLFIPLLAACNSGGQTAVPTSAPTLVQSTVAPATPEATTPPPTTQATAEPARPELLPQPIYLLQDGEILRLDNDGQTLTTLTDEGGAVQEFALSPLDGSLAYVVRRDGGMDLLRSGADGSGRTLVLERDGGLILAPRWRGDGQLLAIRLQPDPDVQTPAPEQGVYLLPVAGGAPELFQADADPAEGLSYAPLAWSPDGTRLLMDTFIPEADFCGMAVGRMDGSPPVELQPELGLTNCSAAVWSTDGATIILTLEFSGASAALLPGLWQADPNSGEVSELLPPQIDEQDVLYLAPQQLSDGRLYTLLGRVDGYDPLAYPPQILEYAPYRIDLLGSSLLPLPVGDVDLTQLYDAAWAPDGSGVVLSALRDEQSTRVVWISFSTEESVELPVDPLQLEWFYAGP